MCNCGFGEGERQGEAKEKGVENGLWLAPSRLWLISDFPFPSDLYSRWVLMALPCQAIHVVGSWVFVYFPLLLPLFFFFFTPGVELFNCKTHCIPLGCACPYSRRSFSGYPMLCLILP